MKYALAYKTEGDNWVFLKFKPSKDIPHGQWGCGMWQASTRDEAEKVLASILEAPNDKRLPFTTDERLAIWKTKIVVVEIPDAAVAKFKEARKLTDWCLAHPREGVPEGSNQNSLFYRGYEIGDIGREGQRILMASIKEQFG